MELSGLSPAVRKRLEALAATFESELPGRLAEIRDAAAHHRREPESAEVLGELRLLVHKLAGAAATFGFESLAGAARQAEHAVDRVLQDESDGRKPAGPVDELIEKLLAYESSSGSAVLDEGHESVTSEARTVALNVAILVNDPVLATGIEADLAERVNSVSSIEALDELVLPSPGNLVVLVVSEAVLSSINAAHQTLRDLLVSHPSLQPIVLVSGRVGERLRASRLPRARVVTAPFSARRISDLVTSMHLNRLHPGPLIAVIGGSEELTERVGRTVGGSGFRIRRETEPEDAFAAFALDPPALVVLCGATGEIDVADWLGLFARDETVAFSEILVIEDGRMLPRGVRVASSEDLENPEVIERLRDIATNAYMSRILPGRDVATGLLSQAAFAYLLEDEIAKATRGGRDVTIAVCIIEARTSSIIETVRLQRYAGSVIEARLRRTDLCGVSGVGEFHLLLGDVGEESAFQVLVGLHQALGDAIGAEFGEANTRVTIGAACYPKFDGPTAVRAAAARACRQPGANGGVRFAE